MKGTPELEFIWVESAEVSGGLKVRDKEVLKMSHEFWPELLEGWSCHHLGSGKVSSLPFISSPLFQYFIHLTDISLVSRLAANFAGPDPVQYALAGPLLKKQQTKHLFSSSMFFLLRVFFICFFMIHSLGCRVLVEGSGGLSPPSQGGNKRWDCTRAELQALVHIQLPHQT